MDNTRTIKRPNIRPTRTERPSTQLRRSSTCESCGRAFRPTGRDSARFCSDACVIHGLDLAS